MARQHRLVLPGLPHLVVLPALAGVQPFAEAADRARFLTLLRDAAAAEGVQVHAYALLAGELRALATPLGATDLARWVQAVGRRHVSAYNRQHGRNGTLWAGRFRSAAVEPGRWTLAALRYVDGATSDPGVSSAAHRIGGVREAALLDPEEYWALGNTPFERESAYARLLAESLDEAVAARLRRCLIGGYVCGDEAFIARLAAGAGMPSGTGPGATPGTRLGARLGPRPRGRPIKRT